MTYLELRSALEIFGLAERVTLEQIKKRHRELVRRYHPDRGEAVDSELIRQVNAAYSVLLEYVENYAFSFGEEEFYRQNPDERLLMQFSDVPLWGSR